MSFAHMRRMRLLSRHILWLSILFACGCGAEPVARCGDRPCHGPPGVPCRCSAVQVASANAAGTAAVNQTLRAELQLDNTAAGSEISLSVGQSVDLTLQTVGPGEYGAAEVSSAALSFDGQDYAPLSNLGGPRQIYRFHAVAPGSATVTIPHTVGGSAFSLTFHVS